VASAVGISRGGSVDLTSCFVAGDSSWTTTLNRALATGLPVEIPYSATPYVFNTAVQIPSGAVIRGKGGRPTLKIQGSDQTRIFFFTNASDCEISDLNIDGDKAGKSGSGGIITASGSTRLRFLRLSITNPIGQISLTSCSFCVMQDLEVFNSGGEAIRLTGCNDCLIDTAYVQNSVSFGVFLLGGSYRNIIHRAKCTVSGLELVGIKYDSYQNHVSECHAQGTGDNGISITGSNNTVVGNTCIGNYHAGIWLYGYGNTCTGNTCKNNGQRFLVDGSHFAGIQVDSEFGGVAHYNAVSGNYCSDDQTTPTQYAGIWLRGITLGIWTAGKTVAVGAYLYFGTNVYQATTAGVTGATAPTHTSGIVSDGAVSWQFISAADTTLAARNNYVVGNAVEPHSGSNEILVDIPGQNTVVGNAIWDFFGWRQVAGDWISLGGVGRNFRRTGTGWVVGQGITYGVIRVDVSTGRTYRCTNVGGTTAGSVPSHTSGSVTGADGIKWQFLYTDAASNSVVNVTIDTDAFKIRHRQALELADNPGSYVYEYAGSGSPEGVVTSPVGSTYRRSDGGAGTAFYVKESGTGATGWVAK
jgi:parallel beta-helix repeat protein